MHRYSLHAVLDMADMKEAPKGQWVKFDEAWPLIAEAQTKLHKARQEIADLKTEIARLQNEPLFVDEAWQNIEISKVKL